MDTDKNINTSEEIKEKEIDVSVIEKKSGPPEAPFLKKNKKLLIIISTILIVAISTFAVYYFITAEKIKKLNDARTKVYEAIRKGDYTNAQKAAKEGFAIDSKDKYLVKNYIDATTAQGNQTGKEAEALKTVEPYIQNLISGDDNNVDDLLAAGYAYEAAGEYDKALSYYEKAVSINPKSAEAHFHKGHVYEFLSRKNDSYIEYDEAYEADNANALALMGKGREAIARGDVEAAFNYFKRSSEAKNVSLQAKSEALTSASLIKQSQIIYMKEAIELAHQAVIANPHFSQALGTYGYLLSINGNPHDGIYYLGLATKENPRISKNYWQIGVVLRAIKRYTDAIKYLNTAIVKIPNDNTLIGLEANRAMGLIYYDLARTYYINDKTSPYVMQSLKYAISTDLTIKDILNKNENQYKIFKDLEANPEFILLRK